MLWGWANIPGKGAIWVHLYCDGVHVASELTGQELPAAVARICGKPPVKTAGFCFALPATAADGFEHPVFAALPEVEDGGLYGAVVTLPAADIHGEIRQQARLLVGIVWTQLPTSPLPPLVIADASGRQLMTHRLPPASQHGPDGYAAAFSVALDAVPAGLLHISCGGQRLRGSPITPLHQLLGIVERCSRDGVTGWAFNVIDPLQPIEMALRVDGKPVCWFRPNIQREDIRTHLGLAADAMGVVGFHVTLPDTFFDGQQHLVEVLSAATGELLTSGSHKVQWDQAGKTWSPRAAAPPATRRQRIRFPSPRVSVVILNRNGAGLMEALLTSWQRYNLTVPAELIVIDHASQDESLAVLKRWKGRLDLTVVPLPRNDSFSASCNRGAAMARGDHLLFLNNDIELLHDLLPPLLDTLQNPTIGIVGVKLLKVVGEAASGKQYSSEVQHLGVRFKLNDGGYWPYEVTPHRMQGEEEFSPQQVPAVTGAALMCSKVDFDAIGGFDTDYFYGFEDVEICMRMTQRLGKQVICRNDCVALHHHGHTRLSGRERNINDRLMANSAVLEAHIGLWLKQAFWHSLASGDGLLTRENPRIGLVGTASQLAAPLANAIPRAVIVLLDAASDWKLVDGLHLLVVGDQRYDIRALSRARADLYTVAWITSEPALWSQLCWWWDFDAVLAPANMTAGFRTALKRPVASSTASNILGGIFQADNFMRVRINAEPAMQARAAVLYRQLKKAGISCWLAATESHRRRMANVSITLAGKGKTARISTAIKAGTLSVTIPPAAQLPTAVWLREILEQKLGRPVHTS